jgi:hypothetical protein
MRSLMAYDFFLSYACMDNESADPVSPEASRWVTTFANALRKELKSELGREPEIFFDQKDLGGNTALTPEIKGALATSLLFVGISSPAYYKRPWCRLERLEFISQLGANPAATGRLFVVHTKDMNAEGRIEEGTWQDEFCPDLKGYFFFRKNPLTGDEMTLGSPALIMGAPGYHDYFSEIRKLAKEMAEQLREMTAPPVPPAGVPIGGPRDVVYLAETASESYPDREEIRVALAGAGYEVRPAGIGRRPEAAYREAVTSAMIGALAFVQVIGPAPQELPKCPVSCDEIQRELAAGLTQIRWRPPGLAVDEALFPAHKAFAAAPDVREQLLPTFKDELLKELKALATARSVKDQAAKDGRLVVISAGEEDIENFAVPVTQRLGTFSLGHLITDSLADELNQEDVHGLLVFYGDVEPEWVRDRLRVIRSLPKTRRDQIEVGIYFPPMAAGPGERPLLFDMPAFRKIRAEVPAQIDEFAKAVSE